MVSGPLHVGQVAQVTVCILTHWAETRDLMLVESRLRTGGLNSPALERGVTGRCDL